MNTLSEVKLGVLLVPMMLSAMVHAYPGESIVRDSVTGDYIITYWNDEMDPPGLETSTYVTATKIVPAIRSRFNSDRGGDIVYRYSVSNGAQSKQVLLHIILDPVGPIIGTRSTRGMKWGTAADKAARMAILDANDKAFATPNGWYSSIAFGVGGRNDNSVRVGWRASVEHSTGLKPGGVIQGFGFSGTALPGIITVELSGDAPVHGWSGEGPPEDSAIIQQLHEIETHDFVPRNAAVPTIAVPVPFDAAVLLDRIRAHVATWPGQQLADPAFAAQLDRYLVAAADAYRLNNAKGGKEHIATLRKMLAKEHHNLDHDDEGDDDTEERKTSTQLSIDRLAARVLDFDLRYVLKRTGNERD